VFPLHARHRGREVRNQHPQRSDRKHNHPRGTGPLRLRGPEHASERYSMAVLTAGCPAVIRILPGPSGQVRSPAVSIDYFIGADLVFFLYPITFMTAFTGLENRTRRCFQCIKTIRIGCNRRVYRRIKFFHGVIETITI